MGAAKNTDSHSVAVTGLSCRFPGDGDTLDTFWESICAGKCKPFLLMGIQRQFQFGLTLDCSGMVKDSKGAF